MPNSSARSTNLRLAELMAALSIATDLGMGQPMEYALTTCIVAVRLGEAAGLSDAELRDTYYEALLRYIGCNADTAWAASIFGDELALRADFAKLDSADQARVFEMMLRYIREANPGADPLQLAQAVLPQLATSFFPGHCEVAQRLATRLGFPESFVRTVGQIYARWDGQGIPALQGEAIAPAVRVVGLAQDAVTFYRLGGVEAAATMARQRRGGAHSPELVEIFCARATQLLAGLEAEPSWPAVLALEPGPQRALTETEFDTACEAIADYADIKSPYFLNHSRRVAELAARTAEQCGLPMSDVKMLRRAGYLHDIGKVGLSAGLWSKSGALNDREWQKVRLHPYYTEQVLARSPELARIGALAALHHERLDGSGYFRGLTATSLPPAARLLAAANTYCALTERRSHRPARSFEQAADELKREARVGRLDGEIVNAVLTAAGHRAPPVKKAVVAGLSEREVEVLRLLARGHTMKQIAAELSIAFKTVDRHIQNIYTKINVSTRAAATLFAMENHLLT
jgi:HD-GYP domain-containing protein (c-di-GMP phosphodiesterase class II)